MCRCFSSTSGSTTTGITTAAGLSRSLLHIFGSVSQTFPDSSQNKYRCASLTPLRQIHAKWVGGYGKPHGRMPSAEMKYWMECIGMPGGPVRSPCLELPEDKKAEMYAELKATGILDRVKTAKKAA